MRILIEACVESVESAIAARAGGAARLELCSNLSVGGTTPSVALIEEVRRAVDIPIAVMVRPRGGSFVHSAPEVEQMIRDIATVRSAGADAVVIGVLDEQQRVDVDKTHSLVRAASGTPVVFHRAFDSITDQGAALDTLISFGVARVLTSGGASTALEGAGALADLVKRAAGRITIMAGGKVRGSNVRDIVQQSGVREVHARCECDEGPIRAIADAMALEQ